MTRPTRLQRWLKAHLWGLMHLRADEKQVALVILSLALMLAWFTELTGTR